MGCWCMAGGGGGGDAWVVIVVLVEAVEMNDAPASLPCLPLGVLRHPRGLGRRARILPRGWRLRMCVWGG